MRILPPLLFQQSGRLAATAAATLAGQCLPPPSPSSASVQKTVVVHRYSHYHHYHYYHHHRHHYHYYYSTQQQQQHQLQRQQRGQKTAPRGVGNVSNVGNVGNSNISRSSSRRGTGGPPSPPVFHEHHQRKRVSAVDGPTSAPGLSPSSRTSSSSRTEGMQQRKKHQQQRHLQQRHPWRQQQQQQPNTTSTTSIESPPQLPPTSANAMHLKMGFTEMHAVNALFQYYHNHNHHHHNHHQKRKKDAKTGYTAPGALDLFVSRYLRPFSMNPHQRMVIVQTVYDMHRWMLLLQYLGERLFSGSSGTGSIASVVRDALANGIYEGVGGFLSREKHILRQTGQTSSQLTPTQTAALIKKMKRAGKKRRRKAASKWDKDSSNSSQSAAAAAASFDVLNHLNTLPLWRVFADRNNQADLLQWRIRYFVYTELLMKDETMFRQMHPISSSLRRGRADLDLEDDYDDIDLAVRNVQRTSGEQNVAAREMRDAMLQEFRTASAHIQVSTPVDLFDILVDNLGSLEAAIEFCKIGNTAAPTYLRVNPLKVKSRKRFLPNFKDSVLATAEARNDIVLSPADVSVSVVKEAPWAVKIDKPLPLNIRDTELYQLGWFEVQDAASQCVADLVRAEPGDRVLDYCAGSGGKTLAFAHKLKHKGVIYMTDVRYVSTAGNKGINTTRNILLEARKRLRRAGIQNCQPLPLDHPELSKIKGTIDWVLLDVPCTGTGTLRRNPELKYKFSLEWLNDLVGIQRSIIEAGMTYLNTHKNSSRLVYSTCSVLKAENEMQVDHILEKYGHLVELETVFRTMPKHSGGDGFFAAVFKSKTSSPREETNDEVV